jgi:hypothetical protein
VERAVERWKENIRFIVEVLATPGGHLIMLNGAVLLGGLLCLFHVPKAEDMMLGAFMAWLALLRNESK